MKKLNTIIRLRRDYDYNFELIKDTFIPANGEVILVDTDKGLRSKVGDGISTFAQLQYNDEILLQEINSVVIYGYYLNDIFFTDSTYTVAIPRELNKIYIDKNSKAIYYYDGVEYVSINDAIPTASDVVAGISKLYQTAGQNTDGSMSQKAVTNGIQAISFTLDDEEEECLVLDLPWN